MRAAPLALVVAIASPLWSAGCTNQSSETEDVRWLDYGRFRTSVQPILAERCGNSSCHGRPERPLSIYSPRRWRADASRTHLDEPLSDAELDQNYTVSCVFADTGATPAGSLLLEKALGATGGRYHGGGVVFDGRTDRGYRAILSWIEEGQGR